MALLSDNDIQLRIESPLNLMNRLREATTKKATELPTLPPKIDTLIQEVDDKLADNANSIKAKASAILIATMDELKNRVAEIHKPEKLSAIAKDMSNIIESQNKKNKSDDTNAPQVLIYSPRIRNENEFITINVNE